MNARQQHLVRLAVLVGIILFGVSGYVWWTKIYTNPERIFWSTAANNLATTGVTREVKDENNTTSGSEQITQLQLGGRTIAATNKTLDGGDGNVVKTQTLITPQKTYTRITDIQTSDKAVSKQQLALVIDVWAKSDTAPEGQVSQSFLVAASGTLPSLPIANLPAKQRNEILHDMKTNKVYSVDFAKSKVQEQHGRQVRVYDVTINVEPLVAMLKKLGTMTGTKEYADADPSKYRDQKISGLQFTIDTKARQIANVYDTNNKFREIYSSYGIALAAQLPTQTVTEAELQSRFAGLGSQ